MAELLQPALYLTHVFCAGLALCAAFFANFAGLSILLFVRPHAAKNWIRPLHVTIAVCLAGLWLTGLALAALKFEPASIPAPVYLKLLLASVLLFNSLLIGKHLAQYAAVWPRPAALHLPTRRLFRMVFCTSLSLTCWIFAVAIALHDNVGMATVYQVTPWILPAWALFAAIAAVLICFRKTVEWIRVRWIGNESSTLQLPISGLEPSPAFAMDRPLETPLKEASPKPPVSMSATVRNCIWALFGIFCISFVTNLLMLTGPLFMLQIYDRVLTSRSIPTLTVLLALVAGLFLFLGILELLRSRVLVRIGQRVDRQINKSVFQKVVSVTPPESKLGKSNLMQDLDSVRQFFSTAAPAAIFDLPWAPLYFAVIFMFHWVLGLIAVAGALVLFLVSLLNEFASNKSVAAAGKLANRSTAYVEAGRRNADILHAMGMFEPYRQRWLDIHRNGISQQLKAADVSGTMSVISKVTRLFLQSLMLAAGAYFAVIGEVSPGVIVAASIILSRALAPVEQIVGQWRNIIAVRHGFGRLSNALSEQVNDTAQITLPQPTGFLSVERLYAGPLGSREPVLKDLNFYVRPGDAVAVVGSNASGKSTLARVLVGVWPTLRGNVRLDGASLAQWPAQQLGKAVGYLPQDVELFEGTVAENIARFDPDATPEMILEAARKAHVHDLIIRLPDGYSTKVGDGGITISGGQRQRIAFARALYGNPALIVLDEPNANLDNEGELALTAAISSLREAGSTVIVMAHRPNVLSAVNLVMVLNDGRQVSFGDKSKVLKDNETQLNTRPRRKVHAKSKTQVFSAA